MERNLEKALWEANKMKGKLDLSELCKVMLYAMFLKHIELGQVKDAEGNTASFSEKFSVGFLALLFGEKISASEVEDYVVLEESRLGLGNNAISSEIRRLLEKADAGQVRRIFESVDEAEVKNSGQMYEAALPLLNKYAYGNGRMNGQMPVNLSLCKLEGRLLDCQEGMRVYDGFCGYGFSVNETAAGRGIVYIQDEDKSAVAIASVMALLKGNKIGAVKCGDSQIDPLPEGQYDRIVCEPPVMPKYNRNYFEKVPGDNCMYCEIQDSASLALRHVLAQLKDDRGVGIVLVPMGILFKSHKEGEVRKKLVEDNYIDAVIELPSGVLPNAATAAGLVILRKGRNDGLIYMVNAGGFFENSGSQMVASEESINKIVRMYEDREELEGVAKSIGVDIISKNGFNLCTTQYVVTSPEDVITIKDSMAYVRECERLTQCLEEIDGQLNATRRRFIKEL